MCCGPEVTLQNGGRAAQRPAPAGHRRWRAKESRDELEPRRAVVRRRPVLVRPASARVRADPAAALPGAAGPGSVAQAARDLEAAPERPPGTGDRARALTRGDPPLCAAQPRLGGGHEARPRRPAEPHVPARVGDDQDTDAHERPAAPCAAETAEAAPAPVYPKVEWHHARSVGLPYAGYLVDGTQLPIDGPAWVTWDPVTDSVPNRPHRLYGNQHTISTIIRVVEAYRGRPPGRTAGR